MSARGAGSYMGKSLPVRLLKPIADLLIAAAFGRDILRSRYFTESRGGYVWALRSLWARNVLRLGRVYPWPVALGCHISRPENLIFHLDDLNNLQSPGSYFQNFGAKIVIGRGCYIAPNVGLITANHRPEDPERHLPGQDIVLGEKCWIGMNAVVLPGVKLGPNTVVAAGAVVRDSHPDGYVILAGVPARPVKAIGESIPNSNLQGEFS